MEILVSSTPAHLKITDGMIEDFFFDPVLAATVLLKEDLDEFQKCRLTICWWTPMVMDSSGFSSGKTRNLWIVSNLRCLLIPDHIGLAAYPVFATGQQSYWKYFNEVAGRSQIFRAQVGRRRIVGLDGKSDEDGKATLKGQSCWTCDYKNGSQIMMPAVGFLQDAKTMASLRINDLICDEHTKSEASGSTGIDDQLIGRATRHCFNQFHPIWCNHLIFSATAEDTMHPSYSRYKQFMREVAAGNPEYAHLSYNYKDHSNRPFGNTGKGFADVLREDRIIESIKKKQSGSGFRQEGLGIWSKNGKSWYSQDFVDAARANGVERGVRPMVTRGDDWERNSERLKQVHFFLSGDPAKADTKKADDGSLVILRAQPRVEKPTNNVSDWMLDYVWAYLVRRADATQWSGIIHRKHKQFGFTGIILDAGPGGGGNWIRPELAKVRQVIQNVEAKVRPIATEEDEATMVLADFILAMFRRGDAKVEKLWQEQNFRGDDNLIDAAHSEFVAAFEMGVFGCPPIIQDIPREVVQTWSEERRWACQLIAKGFSQLTRVSFRTNDDGTTYYSKHGAREFSAKGRKDFAYAMLYAYVRFLMWLRGYEDEASDAVKGEDSEQAW